MAATSRTRGHRNNRSLPTSQNQPRSHGRSLTSSLNRASAAVGSGATSETNPRVIAATKNRTRSVGRRALDASALEEKKRTLRSGLYRVIQVPRRRAEAAGAPDTSGAARSSIGFTDRTFPNARRPPGPGRQGAPAALGASTNDAARPASSPVASSARTPPR